MNKRLFIGIFFSLSSLLSIAQKKKTFLEKLSEGLEVVNGTPSGGTNSGNLRLGGKTIKGSWDEYSAGGARGWSSFSPRNHYYTIEIDRPVQFLEAECSGNIIANLTSKSGKHIWHKGMAKSYPNLESGTYYLTVTGERYDRPNYEIKFFGPVSNFQKTEYQYFTINNQSFDDEGGGGFYAKALSPRNLVYKFEMDRDQYFDIDVESDGVGIDVDVISPNGKQLQVGTTATNGQLYSVDKTPSKGTYTIIVATREINARGTVKIEGVGNFFSKPTKVEIKKEVVNGDWKKNKKISYEIDFESGPQEIILRTSAGEIQINLLDQFSGYVEARRDLQDPGMKNLCFNVNQPGKYKLEMEMTTPTDGDYELLVFGKFKSLTQTGSVLPLKQTNLASNNIMIDSNSPLIPIKGSVATNKGEAFPDNLKIVVVDLESRNIVGETLVNIDNGTYKLNLPSGRRYSASIMADGYLTTSEYIDLRKNTFTSSNTYFNVKPIDIKNISIGSSIILNNIFFDTGKYSLLPESYVELDRLVGFLGSNPNLVVEIAGHTDNVGGDIANQSLSQERANAVVNYLLSKGIEKSTLQAKGYGKNKPMASNSNEIGKSQNRRVEFVIVSKKKW